VSAAMTMRGGFEGFGKNDEKGFVGEEDRVNCPFFFKIGCCRNGDRCTRSHQRPNSSPTLMIPHMYANIPESMSVANDEDWDADQYDTAQDHVEAFFEEAFLELATYGEIEDMVVCDNVSDHMLGNVYVKYYKDDDADKARKGLYKRFFGPALLQPEFSPVMDFRDARCRAFHETRCARGGLCNFMHIKHVPQAIKRRVVRKMYEEHHEYRDATMKTTNAETRDRSRSPKKEADEAPKNENAGGAKKRQSSEDRRAMIATWVKERSSELEAQAAAMHSSLVATLPKMPGVRMPAVPMFVAPPAKWPQVVLPPTVA